MTTWKKWNYLVLAGGWALSMIYETVLNPEGFFGYAVAALLVCLLCVVLFFWGRRKEKKEQKEGKREAVSPYVFYAAAVVVLICFVLSLRRINDFTPPHVPLLPLYVVLLGSCLFSGIQFRRKAEQEKSEKSIESKKDKMSEKSGKTEDPPKESGK